MTTANFVKEVTVIDPDSKGEVELAVFKHSNGGMFAIDSSWIDQCTPDEGDVIVQDPFEERGQTILFGV